MTARSEIEAAEGERRLVDKSWYPNVTLTLGGDDLAGVGTKVTGGVGIKIPLQWGIRHSRRLGTLPHSITSSARASSDCGKVRRSAFAVLRFITSSNLTG